MPQDAPIRILIVDDQSIVLDGLEALLSQDPELDIVGRANNGSEAVELAISQEPDVVLMDISMPEMDGIEATKSILKKLKSTRVLVLSMYNHAEMVNELISEGTSGYVLKNTGKEELKEAILTVASGNTYLGEAVRKSLEKGKEKLKEMGELQFRGLSKREKQITQMIVQEKTSQQIADELFLSLQTVETHRRNVLNKLGLKNTAGLVRYAIERGWVK